MQFKFRQPASFLTIAIFSIMALNCAMASVAVGQEWARNMFSEFAHDFGTVSKNEVAEHRFQIKNIYKEDIRIQSIRTSCACTEISLTKDVLKSEETGELVAVFNTRNFVGPKQATITIKFGSPFNGEVQLTVRGNIRGDVMFEPGELNFGALSAATIAQSNATRQLQITKFNNPSWRIVDVKSTFPHIGVILSNPTRMENQIKYTMDVRIKESAPPGFVQSELILIAEEAGRRTSIPVKFSGKVSSALEISPEVLTFATNENGTKVSKKVIVKASKPFKINDVTCSNSAFTVSADPSKSKKVHFVNISYAADQPPGRYEYDLQFVTDLNKRTTRSIKAVVQVNQGSQPGNEQVGN